jgi:hypothetical protein
LFASQYMKRNRIGKPAFVNTITFLLAKVSTGLSPNEQHA